MLSNYFLLSGLILIISLTTCQSPAKTLSEVADPAAAPSDTALSRTVLLSGSPTVPDSMQLLAPFVPVGYQVLFTVAGDLNRDAWPDRVAVLDTIATVNDSTESEARSQILSINRPLLLLLGQPNGKAYTLAARNDKVVFCADCSGAMGSDPLDRVVIKKGVFSVEQYGFDGALRWAHFSTFKYNSADRHGYLHREGGENIQAMSPEKMEEHVRTVRDFGRISFSDYDYDYPEKPGGR